MSMAGISDPGDRRMLPQAAQMQSLSFAPTTTFAPRENQKSTFTLGLVRLMLRYLGSSAKQSKKCFSGNTVLILVAPADYVFVDEHNRHKRLKGRWYLYAILRPAADRR